MSLPQLPEILLGLSDMDCIFAILVDTGWKSFRNLLQQNGLPQMPRPPSIFASSRTPICLSSIRLRKMPARSLTSSRKSTLPSDVKKKMVLLPSKLHSTSTNFMSRPCSAIFFWHIPYASFSRCLFISATRRSSFVAILTTGRSGCTTALSSTIWLPQEQSAISSPLLVSTMTCSPVFTLLPLGAKK